MSLLKDLIDKTNKPALPNRAELLAGLETIFPGRARDAEASTLLKKTYGRDLWPISFLWQKEDQVPYPPDFVTWAESEEEIVQLIAFCRRHKLPLVPYAGGSGVCGGAIAVTGGVVCDVKKMARVVELNEKDLTCTVEPGMNGQLFEEYLNRKGYTLGQFPSSIYISTVGGWVATRAAGQLSTYYGTINDMVLSLRVALGNGKVVETLSVPKAAQGPDFKEILVGSEGTLGIITRITFKIHPYPAYRGFFAVKAKDVGEGIEFMRIVMRKGLRPAAVRLYDELDTAIIGSPEEKSSLEKKPSQLKKILNSVRHGNGLKTVLKWSALVNRSVNLLMKATGTGCLLLFTFEGEEELVRPQVALINRLAKDMKLDIKGEKPAEYWWNHRYDVSYNSPSVFKAGAFLDTCEVSTTWGRLERLYYKIKEAIQNDVFVMAHFSHAYMTGNNIYFTIAGFEDNYEDSQKKYFRVWDKMMKVCLEEGAALSHHHSIGFFKSGYLKQQMGDLHSIWQAIKNDCDPDGIMNPQKLAV